MKKGLIVFSLFFILIIGYIASKYIFFNFKEDIYYSPTYTSYEGVIPYIKEVPNERVLKPEFKGPYRIDSLGFIKFKIPLNNENDSISSIYNKNSTIINTFKELQPKKSIMLMNNEDDVTANLKKELKQIDANIDTSSSFLVYNQIFSYKPKLNIILDNYKTIDRNLRLANLKSINLVNGGEKSIYRYNTDNIKGFQFCNPKECNTVSASIYNNDKELIIVFRQFEQDEIDFVLNSIIW